MPFLRSLSFDFSLNFCYNYYRKLRKGFELLMKTIYISYTILDIINVPDNCSDEEIHEIVEEHAMDLGIYQLVNDFDWSVSNDLRS